MALRLNEARLEVVLQAQQDVAVRDRRVVFGQQLAFLTGGCLQQFAQLRGAGDYASYLRMATEKSLALPTTGVKKVTPDHWAASNILSEPG